MRRFLRQIYYMGLAATLLVLGGAVLSRMVPEVWSGVPNLIDFTNGMSATTIISTLNSNNAKIENALRTLDASNLASNSVGSDEVIDNSLTSDDLAASSVCGSTGTATGEIGAGCVGSSDLDPNWKVDSSRIQDGTIDTADYKDGSITRDKLAASLTASRLAYNTEAAAQSQTTIVPYMTTVYQDSTGTSNPKATVFCSGYVFVLVDDSDALDPDYFVAIDPNTMTKFGSIIPMAASDDPVAAACGSDGMVYFLTNSGTAGRKLKRLDFSTPATPVITTIAPMSDAGPSWMAADNLTAIAIDPNATNAYVSGSNGTDAEDRWVWRVPLPPAGDPNDWGEYLNADDDAYIRDLLVIIKGGTEYVLFSHYDSGSGACTMGVLTATDPPVLAMAESANLATTGGYHCGGFAFDGQVAAVSDSDGNGDTSLWNVESWTQIGADEVIAWAAADQPAGTAATTFFDGSHFLWQQADGLVNSLRAGAYANGPQVAGMDLRAGLGTAPGGIATDGDNDYFCTANGTTSWGVAKFLIQH